MDTAATILCAKKLVEELLESSSSSDDDDAEIFAVLLEQNIQPPVNNIEQSIINQYTDIELKKKLRISRETARFLIEKYSLSFLRRTYQGGRQQLTVEKQILSFLWFCGNKTTFREVGNLFGMQLSAAHSSFNRVLKFLVNELATDVIKFPQSDIEKAVVAKDFEQLSGFPNVLGCIDRTKISARRSKHISITIQAVCDSKLKFLDVFCNLPSKLQDSRILNLSFIENDLPHICSPNYHILGDSAYPLREFLMTPFQDSGHLSESEKNYNLLFYGTHPTIKNAFRSLKSRFRQLMRLDFHKVDTMAQLIIACCVLHNICIDREDFYDEEVEDNEIIKVNGEPFVEDRRDKMLSQLGNMKRNQLKELLFTRTT